MKRRIISMARAQAIVLVPEGVERIRRGEEVDFRLL
jgi:molybdopterin biosynthesis enzyme